MTGWISNLFAPRRTPARRPPVCLGVEQFADRLAPAVTVSLSGGVLSIVSDAAAADVRVAALGGGQMAVRQATPAGVVTLNTYSQASVAQIRFVGNGGNDVFNAAGYYAGVSTPITIPVAADGGTGDDKLVGGAGADTLEGGTGADILGDYLGNDKIYARYANEMAGPVALKGPNGLYVCAEGGGGGAVNANQTAIGAWETFELVPIDNTFAYRTANGHYLNVTGGRLTATAAPSSSAPPPFALDRLDGGNSLTGGDGNDSLFGSDGADSLDGGVGNDALAGGAGSDALAGGDGSDFVYGQRGGDRIDGGAGNDFLDGNGSVGAITLGDFDPFDGNDTITGGAGDDQIIGRGGADSLYGNDGNDVVDGGFGNDYLDGGAGNDRMYGGYGDDRMYGRVGNDSVFGGSDNDTMDGGSDDDYLDGGSGNDFLNGYNGNDQVFGRGGNDTLADDRTGQLDGGDGRDTIYGVLEPADPIYVDVEEFPEYADEDEEHDQMNMGIIFGL